MARLVGRTRTSPVSPIQRSATIAGTGNNGSTDDHVGSDDASIMSGHSGHSRVSQITNGSGGVGRAGLVRTSTSPATFTPTATHAAVMGRGHNQIQLMQQNYQPFLESTILFDQVDFD
jgi:hypothetical protein